MSGAETALFVVASAIYLYWLYQTGIAIRGLRLPVPPPHAEPLVRFAVLIPAHDEAAVIADLLDTLRDQDYPPSAFDVFVVSDHSTDRTAEIARGRGVTALEREEGAAGKTATLSWALDRVPLDGYQAVAVFDADNIVRPDFLTRMNDYLAAHADAEAVQGYLDVKNPDDSWVTRVYALSFWYVNRFWQLARVNVGLSGVLGGTAQVLRVRTLRRLGWDWRSLTDDLELTCELVLAGYRVHYAYAAVAFDEKPVRLQASVVQRTRWLRGHYWALRRYGVSLVAAAIRRRRLRELDLALHLFVPGRAAISYLTMFAGFAVVIARTALRSDWLRTDPFAAVWIAFGAAALVQCVLVLVAAPSLAGRHVTLRYLPDIAGYFWYGARWLPIAVVRGVMARDDRWIATPHGPAARTDGAVKRD